MAILTGSKSVGENLRPREVDFTQFKGDTFNPTLKFFKADGTGVDMSTFTAECVFTNTALSFSQVPDIELNSEGNGRVKLTLDTTAMEKAVYDYHFTLTDSAGTRKTYIIGTLTIV